MDRTCITKWAKTIEDTIYSPHYVGCEINGNIQVAISVAQIYGCDVYLFGTQRNMDCFAKFFVHEGLCVKGIIDRFGTGGGTLLGIPIFCLDDLCDNNSTLENTIIFSFSRMEGNELENFEEAVKRLKIRHVFYFDGSARATITTNSVEECDRDRIQFYQEHIKEILDMLPYYNDEESYRVMNEYIRTYTERDVYREHEIESKYKYFYDSGRKDIYIHLENEIWLNFGASTGDSIFSFFRNGLKAEKIYAVEAESDRFRQLVNNIQLLPAEMQKTIIPKNIFVDGKTDLDDLTDNHRVTFINADIEGYELLMLQTLKRKIISDHPVLAICLYHKKEDLIDIPSYLIQLYDGYLFYLRKYSYCWGNINRNEELVLYAVPPDRSWN